MVFMTSDLAMILQQHGAAAVPGWEKQSEIWISGRNLVSELPGMSR